MKKYRYKVTFSTYVEATDNFQAVLIAHDHVHFSPNDVCTDVWFKGEVGSFLNLNLPDHIGTYYTGDEGNDE